METVASMRPRLLHLGYLCWHDNHPETFRASMRPRLLHLGYLYRAERNAGLSTSFNEAEAFTPRIHAYEAEYDQADPELQ